MKPKRYIWTWREFVGWPLVWVLLGGVGWALAIRGVWRMIQGT